MKILLASDSFKDSFSSVEINLLLKEILEDQDSGLQTICCPVSDGGEGIAEVLQFHQVGQTRRCKSLDPLFRPIQAEYIFDSGSRTAYIEMAKASGLELLSKQERNCFYTSSFGTGMVICHAIKNGATKVYLFVGGSATNDCGIGMAEAIGYRFYSGDQEIHRLRGKDMSEISRVESGSSGDMLSGVVAGVLCDVQNPLLGPRGAAMTYGAQKGASPEELRLLERGASHLSGIVQSPWKQEGAGAAGGMGFGAQVFLNASIESGANHLFDILEIEKIIQGSDLVVTGEGKLDLQTINGKLISALTSLCMKHKKKIVAISAISEVAVTDLPDHAIDKIYALYENAPKEIDKIDSIKRLKQICKRLIEDYKLSE